MASKPKMLTCDLAVIGMGMTGMAAALFAANRGISTIQVGGTGEIIFASGLMDLLGVHPMEKHTTWDNPWKGISTLIQDIPDHPYARISQQSIRSALDEFFAFLNTSGIVCIRNIERNVTVITSLGTKKLTYCVPKTMWPGVKALAEKCPSLLIGIRGLKGFSAHQIVSTLSEPWPRLHAVEISFPGTGHLTEVYSEHLARSLELEKNREKLANKITPHINGASAVGMPAILGVDRSTGIADDLSRKLGAPVFEIPGMPPSVPGLRLKEAFQRFLPEKGVRVLQQKLVRTVTATPDKRFLLDIGDDYSGYSIRSHGVILASGRFLGQGLRADRNHIRETIFNLPVKQPEGRGQWHRKGFLDPRGHPLNQAGLEIDDLFRPLDDTGNPAFPFLFAAGSILANQDWIRMKCGSGLAIATAFSAVNAFIKCSGANFIMSDFAESRS